MTEKGKMPQDASHDSERHINNNIINDSIKRLPYDLSKRNIDGETENIIDVKIEWHAFFWSITYIINPFCKCKKCQPIIDVFPDNVRLHWVGD